jgi:hypothetical protein
MIRRYQKILFSVPGSDIFFSIISCIKLRTSGAKPQSLHRYELLLRPERDDSDSTEAMALQPALLRASAAATSAR